MIPLVSYAVFPAAYRHRAHNNSGIFYPVIVQDGIICGNWKPFEKRIIVEKFREEDSFPGVENEWRRYQRPF